MSQVIAESSQPDVPQTRSAGATIAYAIHFITASRGAIVRLLWLPTLVQGLILYLSLSLYFTELVAFLQQPDERTAGQALGVLSVGLLSALFFAGIAIVGLAELVSGNPPRIGWYYLRVTRAEWRFFAASVKLLLIFAGFLALLSTLFFVGARFVGTTPEDAIASGLRFGGIAAMIGLFYLFLRFGFLIPPLAVAGHERILRQSWRLSARASGRLGIVVLVLLVPAIVVQIAGDFVLRTSGVLDAGSLSPAIAYLATSILDAFPYLLLMNMISYVVAVVPLTAGAEAAYWRIVSRGPRVDSPS